MPRRPTRLLVPALTLIALTFLLPALATAQPQQKAPLAAAERPEAHPGLFSQLRILLSVLWAETGSVLEPNGASSRPGSAPNATTTGDNGSGLEPDGRH